MLYSNTLYEIRHNINTGVEYEIALFYKLLLSDNEKQLVKEAFLTRTDCAKIQSIINRTDLGTIKSTLQSRNLSYYDCSFETQNDEVGPADIVLLVKDTMGNKSKIGLSVKYANTCTLNVTGMRFITEQQKKELKIRLAEFTRAYVQEMTDKYGNVHNWFRMRKPSVTTDKYIDLIREAVIDNWPHILDKEELLRNLYHADSPIEYWVYEYTNSSMKLNSHPIKINPERAQQVTVEKYQTSYVAFYLDGKRIGHMQVKFNNGFVEKCKKTTADIIVEGVRMSYGQPFSSWNFSVEE